MRDLELTDEQIDVLLKDIMEEYGYDFNDYASPSMKRRLNRLYALDKFLHFDHFHKKIIQDAAYFQYFVEEVTVNVTEMFRDPLFFQRLREEVLPDLARFPFIRIWHAGCSTGEEVYSMAILLKEAGLLQRSLLYATDINPAVLEVLRKGIYPLRYMKQYSENYIQSGGTQDFSRYYTAKYDWAKLDEGLLKRIVISPHNLVSDSSFNEFQLIICRNVLIYFSKPLQNKALQLIDNSLEPTGYVALGGKESLKYSSIASRYKQLPNRQRIWRKIT